MKILTLTQPWATLVAIGAKHIETRSWSTAYRGPLAIHAGAGLGPVDWEPGLIKLIRSGLFYPALINGLYDGRLVDESRIARALPRGAIVAVCDLVGCRPTVGGYTREGDDPAVYRIGYALDGGICEVSDQERAFGDYGPDRYAWLLDNIRPLPEPLPYRGAQGLRNLDEATANEVVQRAAQ